MCGIRIQLPKSHIARFQAAFSTWWLALTRSRLWATLGTLSKHVFEQRTSTGSEAFSLFICLDANKLVLLSFFSLLKTIYPRVSSKPLPNDAKSPLPVDVRCSKTLLLKLPIVSGDSDQNLNTVNALYLRYPLDCSLRSKRFRALSEQRERNESQR